MRLESIEELFRVDNSSNTNIVCYCCPNMYSTGLLGKYCILVDSVKQYLYDNCAGVCMNIVYISLVLSIQYEDLCFSMFINA